MAIHFEEGALAPIVLHVLLQVHTSDEIMKSRSHRAALECLQRHGLIEADSEEPGWLMTGKGRAHLLQLCQLPFPVPMDGWMSPITKQALS